MFRAAAAGGVCGDFRCRGLRRIPRSNWRQPEKVVEGATPDRVAQVETARAASSRRWWKSIRSGSARPGSNYAPTPARPMPTGPRPWSPRLPRWRARHAAGGQGQVDRRAQGRNGQVCAARARRIRSADGRSTSARKPLREQRQSDRRPTERYETSIPCRRCRTEGRRGHGRRDQGCRGQAATGAADEHPDQMSRARRNRRGPDLRLLRSRHRPGLERGQRA